MMSALLSAIALMTILCLLLGLAYLRLYQRLISTREFDANRRKDLIEEMNKMRRYISGVHYVLNTNVGGIGKRLSESAEIAEAIQLHAPDLFKQCEGLAYWLHANDQFLANLSESAAEGIWGEKRCRINEMNQAGRADIFNRIYEGANLIPPLHHQQSVVSAVH